LKPAKRFEDNGDLSWNRYCGFFDLTPEEFQAIQNELLSQQLLRVNQSAVSARIFGGAHPHNVHEFVSQIPLTSYADYADFLNNKDDRAAVGKVANWMFTSVSGGSSKWIPYTEEAIQRVLDSSIAAILQAAATHKGEVNIRGGETFLNSIAPSPFLTGLLFDLTCETLGLRSLPPSGNGNETEFAQRIEKGLQMATSAGLDIVASLPSVLVRIGEMTSNSRKRRGSVAWPVAPRQLGRLARVLLFSRWGRRPILPRDLWNPKVVLSWGLDTDSYRPRIREYWGKDPLEFYGCTEAGILGIQAFDRQGLTLVPYSAFFEFIPEEQTGSGQTGKDFRPATVLLGGLEVGKRYEVVLSSFYGMPFFRYRVGHLVKVLSIGNSGEGASLPRIALVGRADQTIDIGGFTRLDERTLLEALSMCSFAHGDWVAAKELLDGAPCLHFYIETDASCTQEQLVKSLNSCLRNVDPGYNDLERMLGVDPLRVTLLKPGTFESYREQQKRQGANSVSAGLVRVNPPRNTIEELLNASKRQSEI